MTTPRLTAFGRTATGAARDIPRDISLDISRDATQRARGMPRGTMLVTLLVIVSLALVVLAGEPAAGLLPLLAIGSVWGLMRLPVRWLLFVATALVAIADITVRGDPYATDEQVWSAPTAFLYPLLIDNLHKLTHVDALRFSGMEFLLMLAVVLAALRAYSGQTMDLAGSGRAARAMLGPLVLAFLVVIWLEVLGIGRGGDVRQSLWQLRYMLWCPIIAMLAMYSLRGMRDMRTLLYVLTVTSAIKVTIGIYYYAGAVSKSYTPQTITSHADTVLWIVVIAVWIAAVVERPTRQRFLAASGVITYLLIGVVLNNRRTAYVTLITLLVVYFALLPARIKRPIWKVLLLASPVIALYLAAGTRKTTGIFAPAAAIMSVTSQKDASSGTRDIENYNLIVTLKTSKIFGTGWGHEYIEAVKALDISVVFAQYRYVAHNSVLWLWSIGGFVGFTLLWMPIGVAVYLARRAHYFARSPDERLAAYASMAVITAFELQAWSDMGVLSWATMSMLGFAFAIAAKLAGANGAWPARPPKRLGGGAA